MEADRTAPYIPRLEEAFNRMIKFMNSAATAYQSVAPGPMLSGSQRIVLRALANNGPYQVSEVANQLGVTLSAATGLVDRLVKAKLVTRERDQEDRRVVWVKITPEGEQAVQAAESRRRAAFKDMVQNLPEEELARLCDILERLG
ncbi:MAG: MarR family winged helix-turn-helix transcriptional regulator [Bacillota bacterium]